jgi:carbonic anhydrase
VHAALSDRRVGLADNWLRHVKDVHQKHERYLGEVLPTPKRQDRLCELNVIEQAVNVCETTIVQDAWARGQDLTVHGWAYRLDTGIVKDLGMSCSSIEEMEVCYKKTLTRYDAE